MKHTGLIHWHRALLTSFQLQFFEMSLSHFQCQNGFNFKQKKASACQIWTWRLTAAIKGSRTTDEWMSWKQKQILPQSTLRFSTRTSMGSQNRRANTFPYTTGKHSLSGNIHKSNCDIWEMQQLSTKSWEMLCNFFARSHNDRMSWHIRLTMKPVKDNKFLS